MVRITLYIFIMGMLLLQMMNGTQMVNGTWNSSPPDSSLTSNVICENSIHKVFSISYTQRWTLYILCGTTLLLNILMFTWKTMRRQTRIEHSITSGSLSCAGFLHGIALLQIILIDNLSCELRASQSFHISNMCTIAGVCQLSAQLCASFVVLVLAIERLRRTKRVLLTEGIGPIPLSILCLASWIIAVTFSVVLLIPYERQFYTPDKLCFGVLHIANDRYSINTSHNIDVRLFSLCTCLCFPVLCHGFALGVFISTLIRKRRLERFIPQEELAEPTRPIYLPKKVIMIVVLNLISWSPLFLLGK